MRFASRSARLGQPEINIGFLPPVGATQAYVGLINCPKALKSAAALAAIHRSVTHGADLPFEAGLAIEHRGERSDIGAAQQFQTWELA